MVCILVDVVPPNNVLFNMTVLVSVCVCVLGIMLIYYQSCGVRKMFIVSVVLQIQYFCCVSIVFVVLPVQYLRCLSIVFVVLPVL